MSFLTADVLAGRHLYEAKDVVKKEGKGRNADRERTKTNGGKLRI